MIQRYRPLTLDSILPCYKEIRKTVLLLLLAFLTCSTTTTSQSQQQKRRRQSVLYQACTPGHYGHDCSGTCHCNTTIEDCNDGPTGDGICIEHPSLYNFISSFIPTSTSPLLLEFNHERQSLALRVEPIPKHGRLSRRPRKGVNATLVHVVPTPFQSDNLALLAFDNITAEAMGLHNSLTTDQQASLTDILSGRILYPNSRPYAHCYGGHQFGTWSGQLGDGRAITIGEVCTTIDDEQNQQERQQCLEVSLKGSGKTPFSRGGDGRATLQSATREFLASVALPAIGIPSVRALAIVAPISSSNENENNSNVFMQDNVDAETDYDSYGMDDIVRDEWYTSNPQLVPSAVLTRVSPSFLRIGSLQIIAKRQGFDALVQTARWVLRLISELEERDDPSAQYLYRIEKVGPYSHDDEEALLHALREECFFTPRDPGRTTLSPSSCASSHAILSPTKTLECLLQTTSRQLGALVASWYASGFTHGVLNTDNISPLGTTIDLNVFGFMERFQDNFTPNAVDNEKRYAFGRQAVIMEWNLKRLVDAMSGTRFVKDYEQDRDDWMYRQRQEHNDDWPWLDRDVAEDVVESNFRQVYHTCRSARLRLRLGLPLGGEDRDDSNTSLDEELVEDWIKWLQSSAADYHRANRALAEVGPLLLGSATAEGDVVEAAATMLNTVSGGDSNFLPDLAQWLEKMSIRLEREQQSYQERMSVIDGTTTCRTTSSMECESKENNNFTNLWAAQIRMAAPMYILRTSFTRNLTDSIVEKVKSGTATSVDDAKRLISVAATLLKDPFQIEEWRISRRRDDDDISDGDTSIYIDGNSNGDDPLQTWISNGFSALSPRRRSNPRDVQTSCGGQ